jgi:LysM repeat protein
MIKKYSLTIIASMFLYSCGGGKTENQNALSAPVKSDEPAAYDASTPDTEVATTEKITHEPNIPSTPKMQTEITPNISQTQASGRTHTIVAGDSLWKIGKQYNIKIDAIKIANNMTTDKVVLGKKLIIPAE